MATQFLVLQHLRNVANCVLCTYLILLVVHALVIACNISFLSFEALSQQRAPQNEWIAKIRNDSAKYFMYFSSRLCIFLANRSMIDSLKVPIKGNYGGFNFAESDDVVESVIQLELICFWKLNYTISTWHTSLWTPVCCVIYRFLELLIILSFFMLENKSAKKIPQALYTPKH